MRKPLLSVIVPAYKQEKTIVRDLKSIETALKQMRYGYEIICVVDGRVDKTYETAKKISSSKIKVFGYKKNQGKGYAVRYGMARAKGDPIAFIDSGMEINPNGIGMILEHMEWYEADIIIGSKRHPASQVNYPLSRRMVSFCYQFFVRLFAALNVRDTQAGLKIFRRKVLEDVLPRLMVKRYVFDLELLSVAYRLGYKRIYEAPVKLKYFQGDSTHAVTLKDFFKPNGLLMSFADTLAVIYRLRILRYYDNQNRKKWINDRNLGMKVNLDGKEKIKVSVIIPVRTITPYVRETMAHLKKQTYKDFEVIIVTDVPEKLAGATVIASGEPTPAFKRNLGVKKAKGEILAFLDDDSYPEKEWLKNALEVFRESGNIVGVGGPTLTPPADNIYQKVSGRIWASWLGSGGAGVYRNKISPRRTVDDFPSVNLLVRKNDFLSVGGFDVQHWPGEDTKLCLDLVKLGKKIIYDPQVLVYHHRRPVFLPHLKQISRYALRRGHFARIFPETSFRLGYFLPSIFAYFLVLALAAAPFSVPARLALSAVFSLYLLAMLTVYFEVLFQEKDLYLTFLTVTGVFLTHLTYGFLFPFGYFQRSLKTVPHKIDIKRGVYIGG